MVFGFEKTAGTFIANKEGDCKGYYETGGIDLNEEDRELIIYPYNSNSSAAIGNLSQKAVAEYYMKLGFDETFKGSGPISSSIKIMRSTHEKDKYYFCWERDFYISIACVINRYCGPARQSKPGAPKYADEG